MLNLRMQVELYEGSFFLSSQIVRFVSNLSFPNSLGCVAGLDKKGHSVQGYFGKSSYKTTENGFAKSNGRSLVRKLESIINVRLTNKRK